jgi:hypothetical protein
MQQRPKLEGGEQLNSHLLKTAQLAEPGNNGS